MRKFLLLLGIAWLLGHGHAHAQVSPAGTAGSWFHRATTVSASGSYVVAPAVAATGRTLIYQATFLNSSALIGSPTIKLTNNLQGSNCGTQLALLTPSTVALSPTSNNAYSFSLTEPNATGNGPGALSQWPIFVFSAAYDTCATFTGTSVAGTLEVWYLSGNL
jgi:hypothetical protein